MLEIVFALICYNFIFIFRCITIELKAVAEYIKA